jgi:hypothetical protein
MSLVGLAVDDLVQGCRGGGQRKAGSKRGKGGQHACRTTQVCRPNAGPQLAKRTASQPAGRPPSHAPDMLGVRSSSSGRTPWGKQKAASESLSSGGIEGGGKLHSTCFQGGETREEERARWVPQPSMQGVGLDQSSLPALAGTADVS